MALPRQGDGLPTEEMSLSSLAMNVDRQKRDF